MRSYRVIIVDDESLALTSLGHLLDKYEQLEIIGHYSDARKAFQAVKTQKPDILFTDIEMPGYDGLDLVSDLGKEGCKPITVFITGHEHYAIKAIKEQAFDYLLKPVDVNELNHTLNRILENDIQPGQMNADLPCLSDREKEILQLLARGLTSKEIADRIHLSKNTVDTHRRNMIRKTPAQNTAELIALYFQA